MCSYDLEWIVFAIFEIGSVKASLLASATDTKRLKDALGETAPRGDNAQQENEEAALCPDIFVELYNCDVSKFCHI